MRSEEENKLTKRKKEKCCFSGAKAALVLFYLFFELFSLSLSLSLSASVVYFFWFLETGTCWKKSKRENVTPQGERRKESSRKAERTRGRRERKKTPVTPLPLPLFCSPHLLFLSHPSLSPTSRASPKSLVLFLLKSMSLSFLSLSLRLSLCC